MSAALSLTDAIAVTAAGCIVRRSCGCGQCGKTFETVLRRQGQQRVYAVDCPVRQEQLKEQNRLSAKRAAARVRAQSPRRCHCGCGKALPPRIWYHPDCQDKKADRRSSTLAAPRSANGRCGVCQGQSWRRHPELGCLRCGGVYAPEVLRRREPVLLSSALGQAR